MPLYEVALIQAPTKKESEDGAAEKLILAPTAVIASDDKAAAVQAVAANKDKVPADLNRVTVLVRPFA
jgi:membrane peptidoglycan carboxypeptidase